MLEESIMLVTTPLLDFVKHVANTKHVLLLRNVKTSVEKLEATGEWCCVACDL
jgi:hypothetical protein